MYGLHLPQLLSLPHLLRCLLTGGSDGGQRLVPVISLAANCLEKKTVSVTGFQAHEYEWICVFCNYKLVLSFMIYFRIHEISLSKTKMRLCSITSHLSSTKPNPYHELDNSILLQ